MSSEKWAVGFEHDAETSARMSVENMIDDNGYNSFSTTLVESHIDGDEVAEEFRSSEEDNIRENLEHYFDEEDYEYDEEVQNRIDEIEELLEDPEELTQEQYDELNEELEELKDSEKTIPENLIDEKVEERLSEISDNALEYLKDYGYDYDNFIDQEALISDVVSTDGYGNLINHWDGSEETVEFDNETYYIFQIDR
jgi:hypothetical protein